MKRLKLLAIAFAVASPLLAQESADSVEQTSLMDEQAFTFTEAQLGEDDDMSQNVSIIHSNNNIYASQVGYLFSPTTISTPRRWDICSAPCASSSVLLTKSTMRSTSTVLR